MPAQQAHVLYCVQFDAETKTCTLEAWMPAPSILPPLSVEQAGQLLTWVALVFVACWGWKKLGQHVNNH